MTGAVPSIDELRARAAREDVKPTDDDLERVQGFLTTLLPALGELERSLPPGAVPAALFRPETEP